MFLVGNQQHTLDDKNRIRLPAKHREALGSNYILMPGMNGCIFVYPADEEQKLLRAIQDMDSFDPDCAEWIRSIAEFSATVEADSQGRFYDSAGFIGNMRYKKGRAYCGRYIQGGDLERRKVS